MTELVNYGMDEKERTFVIRCLRDMGNHYHNLEREMREEGSLVPALIDKFNEDATTCVLIADKIAVGSMIVITNYPMEEWDDPTM